MALVSVKLSVGARTVRWSSGFINCDSEFMTIMIV